MSSLSFPKRVFVHPPPLIGLREIHSFQCRLVQCLAELDTVVPLQERVQREPQAVHPRLPIGLIDIRWIPVRDGLLNGQGRMDAVGDQLALLNERDDRIVDGLSRLVEQGNELLGAR